MIYPEMSLDGNNQAENYIWEYLNTEFFKDTLYSIHQIKAGDEKVDAVLMIPNKGIIIMACRDYTADIISGITNHRMIKLLNRPVEYAPLVNAIAKRGAFINQLKNNNVLFDEKRITSVCCYPFVTEEEFKRTGLQECSPRDLTILKDDFESDAKFINKISDIFEYISKMQNINVEIDFDESAIKSIGNIFVKNFDSLVDKQKEYKVREYKIDLHAKSEKELNYGICTFLMKNGITSGEIYSSSREILDSLGDYMTSVKIPWSYKSDELNNIGYQFVDAIGPTIDDGRRVIIVFNGKTSICVKQGEKRKFNIEVHNKNSIYETLDDVDIIPPIHLKNEQIRQMFLKAFKVAEKEIDIISPWMNFGVVDDSFVELMRSTLKRGVVIKIVYGLKPSSSEFNQSRSNRSDQVARFLQEEFKEYSNQLCIKRDNIHYKLVLCDEKFKLEGGYNYLSFVGNYEDEDTRKEGSPFGTNIDEIRYLRKEYFDSVN